MQIELVHSVGELSGRIVTQISIYWPENPKLTISQFHYGKGHSNEPSIEKQLSIKDIDLDILKRLTKILEDWIDSKASPRLFDSIKDIDVEFSIDESPNTEIKTFDEINSDILVMSIDDNVIELTFDVENYKLDIPVGKNIDIEETKSEYGTKKADVETIIVSGDNKNAVRLRDFFVDFFDMRCDEDISIKDRGENIEKTATNKIELIFERFDKIIQQLDERSRGREPLKINDEYDLQYLLQAILRLYFDDVRDESYLKQHAGVSPRIDFLIENEKIGIETKRLGENRSPKEIAGEVAEDKELYRDDSDVDTLLFLLYDPTRLFNNPAEYEKDLSEDSRSLETRVTVMPK